MSEQRGENYLPVMRLTIEENRKEAFRPDDLLRFFAGLQEMVDLLSWSPEDIDVRLYDARRVVPEHRRWQQGGGPGKLHRYPYGAYRGPNLTWHVSGEYVFPEPQTTYEVTRIQYSSPMVVDINLVVAGITLGVPVVAATAYSIIRGTMSLVERFSSVRRQWRIDRADGIASQAREAASRIVLAELKQRLDAGPDELVTDEQIQEGIGGVIDAAALALLSVDSVETATQPPREPATS